MEDGCFVLVLVLVVVLLVGFPLDCAGGRWHDWSATVVQHAYAPATVGVAPVVGSGNNSSGIAVVGTAESYTLIVRDDADVVRSVEVDPAVYAAVKDGGRLTCRSRIGAIRVVTYSTRCAQP